MPSTPHPETPASPMDRQSHWQGIYTTRSIDQVSWYRPHLDSSLALIERIVPDLSLPILDVGAGASTLADDLLAGGYSDLTILDISAAALDLARQRLGSAAGRIHWITADILTADLPPSAFALWHDRAVFHFLTDAHDRAAYSRQLIRALRPASHALICTFGPDGPQKCSGLPVVRYDAASLLRELGPRFRLIESFTELHQTPSGSTQQFLCCHAVLAD